MAVYLGLNVTSAAVRADLESGLMVARVGATRFGGACGDRDIESCDRCWSDEGDALACVAWAAVARAPISGRHTCADGCETVRGVLAVAGSSADCEFGLRGSAAAPVPVRFHERGVVAEADTILLEAAVPVPALPESRAAASAGAAAHAESELTGYAIRCATVNELDAGAGARIRNLLETAFPGVVARGFTSVASMPELGLEVRCILHVAGHAGDYSGFVPDAATGCFREHCMVVEPGQDGLAWMPGRRTLENLAEQAVEAADRQFRALLGPECWGETTAACGGPCTFLCRSRCHRLSAIHLVVHVLHSPGSAAGPADFDPFFVDGCLDAVLADVLRQAREGTEFFRRRTYPRTVEDVASALSDALGGLRRPAAVAALLHACDARAVDEAVARTLRGLLASCPYEEEDVEDC